MSAFGFSPPFDCRQAVNPRIADHQASPTEIYAAFKDPAALLAWLPPASMTGEIHAFDARVGGGYVMSLFYPPGERAFRGKTVDRQDRLTVRFLELTPPRSPSPDGIFESWLIPRSETLGPRFRGDDNFLCCRVPRFRRACGKRQRGRVADIARAGGAVGWVTERGDCEALQLRTAEASRTQIRSRAETISAICCRGATRLPASS
jgi:hypothetical protein